jgi:hypothetical protein
MMYDMGIDMEGEHRMYKENKARELSMRGKRSPEDASALKYAEKFAATRNR